MAHRFLPVLLICCLLVLIPGLCMAQIYRWVDEQGTIHFSENPPPEALKSPKALQGKNRDKEEVHRREKEQEGTQNRKPDRHASREDTQEILKNLEVGNRKIPEDMKKYAPNMPGSERPRGTDGPVPQGGRRTSS